MKIFKMESGKLAKWLAIIFVGAALISGLALVASGLPRAIRNRESWPTVRYDPGKDLSFDASQGFPGKDVKEVTADFSFETVEIRPSDDSDFHVRYVGIGRNLEDWETIFTMELRGEVLFLDSHWRGNLPMGGVNAEIHVPAGYSGSLQVESGSGRLSAENLEAGNLGIHLSSGSLDVRNVRADVMTLRNGSGGLDVEDIRAGTLELRAVSGGIRGDGLTADDIEVKTSSGRAVLKDVSGSLVMDGSSGSANISFSNPGSLVDVRISSGSIDVALPPDTGFSLEASSSSGRIQSDFPVSVTGDLARNRLIGDVGNPGGRVVKLRTSSGSINLKEE